jgi:xanthine/CO dehydrogenase XdhC/CoxF family maturation factor
MAPEYSEILQIAENWLGNTRQVAIATVIETWGSSPRPAGSQLVVDASGRFEGSVSGGCVETAVISAALEVLQTGQPRILEFGVSNDLAWEVGLACGGKIRVYVEPVTEAQSPAKEAP